MTDVLIFSDEDPVRITPARDELAELRAALSAECLCNVELRDLISLLRAERDRLRTNIHDAAREITALRQQVASAEKLVEELEGLRVTQAICFDKVTVDRDKFRSALSSVSLIAQRNDSPSHALLRECMIRANLALSGEPS